MRSSASRATFLSAVREWLNGDFYEKAFSAEEKEKMLSATVTNAANPDYHTGGGADTEDMVYLLSAEEAEALYAFGRDRVSEPTAWCARTWFDIYPGYEKIMGYWWLRTSGGMAANAAYVGDKGAVNLMGTKANAPLACVRPVITLDATKRP